MTYLVDMTKFNSQFLKKLQDSKSTNRGAVSLYLDKDLYAKFKEAIEPLTISEVVEGFMKEIVESETKKK